MIKNLSKYYDLFIDTNKIFVNNQLLKPVRGLPVRGL